MNDDRTFKPEEIVSKLRAENLRLKNVIEIANHRISELESENEELKWLSPSAELLERLRELENANTNLQETSSKLTERIRELEEIIVAEHNPHTGNECDCEICEKFGPRGTR